MNDDVTLRVAKVNVTEIRAMFCSCLARRLFIASEQCPKRLDPELNGSATTRGGAGIAVYGGVARSPSRGEHHVISRHVVYTM